MRPYAALRGKCMEFGLDQAYLAREHNPRVSVAYISRRFSGAVDWGQGDMYWLMEIIGEPDDMLHHYFPPKGITAVQKLRAVK